MGIVPGPALKDQKQLAQPVIPKGPIPMPEMGTPSPTSSSNAKAIPSENAEPADARRFRRRMIEWTESVIAFEAPHESAGLFHWEKSRSVMMSVAVVMDCAGGSSWE